MYHLVVCYLLVHRFLNFLIKHNYIIINLIHIYIAEQFLFDRSKQQNIASFITEPDIVEDNEDIDESSSSLNEDKYNLPELEKAKLISCLEAIRNIIGDTVPESKLKEKIIASNFDTDVALDAILKESSPKNGMFIILI